ncbi:hypothetical protein C2G38_1220512 [Gigaspora rosea]|uniref:Uncharacterized protein n=1 Tax=Gigaspora rosea TaxID=44941 RepID=A0A397VJP5_9GLOM|nr:hypothetical protein C2G38_1220512 [Gigaspora rosea]
MDCFFSILIFSYILCFFLGIGPMFVQVVWSLPFTLLYHWCSLFSRYCLVSS